MTKSLDDWRLCKAQNHKKEIDEWNARWKAAVRNAGFTEHNLIDYFKWRKKHIWDQRNAGRTYVSLGKELGITNVRARQIYLQYEQVKRRDDISEDIMKTGE